METDQHVPRLDLIVELRIECPPASNPHLLWGELQFLSYAPWYCRSRARANPCHCQRDGAFSKGSNQEILNLAWLRSWGHPSNHSLISNHCTEGLKFYLGLLYSDANCIENILVSEPFLGQSRRRQWRRCAGRSALFLDWTPRQFDVGGRTRMVRRTLVYSNGREIRKSIRALVLFDKRRELARLHWHNRTTTGWVCGICWDLYMPQRQGLGLVTLERDVH